MLREAGYENVRILLSPGHNYTVMNLDPDADIADPRTWGANAQVVDGWQGRSYTAAEAFENKWIANGGASRPEDETFNYHNPRATAVWEKFRDQCNEWLRQAQEALDGKDPAKARELTEQYQSKNCAALKDVKPLPPGLEQQSREMEEKIKEALEKIESQMGACEYEKALVAVNGLQAVAPGHAWLAQSLSDLREKAAAQKETRDHLRTARDALLAKKLDGMLDSMEAARKVAPACMAEQIQTMLDDVNRRLESFKDATSRASDLANGCDLESAFRAAQEASEISPDHPWVLENFPKIRDLLDRKGKAQALIDQAVSASKLAKKPQEWDRVISTLQQARAAGPSCLWDQIDQLLAAANGNRSALPAPVETSLILLIDTSGSMQDNGKIGQAKGAAINAVRKMGAGTEVAVIAFSGSCAAPARVVHGFSTQNDAIVQSIEGLSTGGGTPMVAAIGFATDYLTKNARGKTAEIILMCDGQNDCGAASDANTSIRSTSIPTSVSTIGFDIPDNSQAATDLQAIASQNGGRSYSARDSRELVRAFSRAMLMNAIKKDDGAFASPDVGPRVQAYFSRAQEALRRNDFPTALLHYQQAHKLAPASPGVNFNLSLVYEEQDQLLPAIEHAESYLGLVPSAFDGNQVRARITSMRQELARNPRERLDPAGCKDVYLWAKGVQEQTRKSKDPAQKSLLFNVLIAAQKGDCGAARADQQKYKGTYGGG